MVWLLHKQEDDYRASGRGWHIDIPWQGSCGFPGPSLRLRGRAIIQDSQCGLLGTIYSK